MSSSLLLQGSLQHCDLLFTLCSGRWHTSVEQQQIRTFQPYCNASGQYCTELGDIPFCPLCNISIPELLLGGCGIQSILKLCLKSLQLFTEVSLLLFCFVSCSFFRLQVFLEIRNYRFQFSDLLEGVVLLSSFIFKPFWKKSVSFWKLKKVITISLCGSPYTLKIYKFWAWKCQRKGDWCKKDQTAVL